MNSSSDIRQFLADFGRFVSGKATFFQSRYYLAEQISGRDGLRVYFNSDEIEGELKEIDLLDNVGNYFYLRLNGTIDYVLTEYGSGCDQSYRLALPVRFVANLENVDRFAVARFLQNIFMSDSERTIIRSLIWDAQAILQSETDYQDIFNFGNRTLLAFDLTLNLDTSFDPCLTPEICGLLC